MTDHWIAQVIFKNEAVKRDGCVSGLSRLLVPEVGSFDSQLTVMVKVSVDFTPLLLV